MKPVLITAILLLCSSILFGEEEAAEAPPKHWTGSAELSFVSTTGNTDTQTLGVGGEVEYKPNVWSFLGKAAFIRSEADGIANARSLDTLFRVSRQFSERLKAFGQFGYYQNEFAGIDDRFTLEGGVSYLLINHPTHTLETSAGIGYVNEDRVDMTVDPHRSFASAPLGAVYKWKFSDNAEVGDEFLFTLNLSEGSDWRFANTVYVAAKLTTIFSLKFSNAVTYLNEPVVGFGKTDTITSAALVAKF